MKRSEAEGSESDINLGEASCTEAKRGERMRAQGSRSGELNQREMAAAAAVPHCPDDVIGPETSRRGCAVSGARDQRRARGWAIRGWAEQQ